MILRIGSIGAAVKQLQEKLLSLGYNPNGIDGIFGQGTNKAVKEYQKHNKLIVDGIVGPETLTKLYNINKSKYYQIGNAHIIETDPENIKIQILGNTLKTAGVYGINGTFFDTPRPQLPGSCWGIATNNGKPIGGNSMLVSYDKNIRRGTIVYYGDGIVEVLRVNNIDEIGPHKWAISGYMIHPDMDFAYEKMPSGIDYRTAHTYIGYKGKSIYLIVKPNHMIKNILPLIRELKLEGCIVLDGGGSSQLRHPEGSILSSRKINSAILLKEV